MRGRFTVALGLGLALAASLVSFVLALAVPHFLNMFWQIPDGEEMLRGHFPQTVAYAIVSGPLISQEWLFEIALALAARAHAYGCFVLACAIAAAATPLLVYVTVRAFGIGDLAAGIVAFLVLGSRLAGSAIRPETFAVDAFAVELYLLGRGRGRIWIVPCVALWANFHASVVLAPIAAAAFAAGRLIQQRTVDASVRRSVLVTGATLVATLLTPYGFRLWSYAIAVSVGSSPVRQHLDAWHALAFDVPGSVAAVLPGLILFVALGTIVRRTSASELIVAAIVLAMTIAHGRYAMFLVVGWAPALARSLDARLGSAVRRAPAIALAPLAIFAAAVAAPKPWTPLEPVGPWQTAAGIVADHHLHGNAYATYVWAAFLHWRGLPVRLLIDGHGDPYPREVWNDHLALEGLRPNWRDVLRRRAIRVVVVPLDSPLAQALFLEPSWRTVEQRDGIVAFEPRAPG